MPTTVPAFSFGLFVYMFQNDLGEPYGGYPDWMLAIGWAILLSLLAITLIGGLWQWNKIGISSLPELEQKLSVGAAMAEAPAAEAPASEAPLAEAAGAEVSAPVTASVSI